jgi:hypothetical protein
MKAWARAARRSRFSLSRARSTDTTCWPTSGSGPDGKLYQLASLPDEGVTVERYVLR